MEVNVERLGPVEVRLSFEVSAADCDRELNRAYKAYASRMRLPGFRPGKVPVRRVKKQLEAQVVHEVSEVIIERAFRDALQQEDLRPVLAPRVEGHPHCHEGHPFHFAMTVEVRPDIELKKIDGFDIKVERRDIDEAAVTGELGRLRLSKAEFNPAAEGTKADSSHRVSVTFDAWHGEKQVAEGESRSFYLGDEDLEGQIRDALLGAAVGDKVDADITFSDDNANPDLAGETVKHSFEVTGLDDATLPDLDDDFAKLFEADDLDGLTQAVRERLESLEAQQAERAFEEAVIEALVESNPFDVPPGLVQLQLDRTLERALPGVKPEQIAQMGVDLDAFREEVRPQALRGVQIGLLLEEIAEAEDITPGPQDVAQEMVRIAQQSKQPLAQVQQQFKKPEVMEQILADLRSRQALAFVVNAAKGKTEEEAS